eukprot:gene23081-biopygen19302
MASVCRRAGGNRRRRRLCRGRHRAGRKFGLQGGTRVSMESAQSENAKKTQLLGRGMAAGKKSSVQNLGSCAP